MGTADHNSGVAHEKMVEMMKKDAAKQEPLVIVIARMLEETVQRNDQNNKKSTLSSFQGLKPPLSACSFVKRLAKYSGASPCCFAVGLIYLERIKKRDPGVCLTPSNFQRLFLVAVMTASKFLDDFYYSNKHWAEVGGIQTGELNRLELEFLFRIGFSLHMQRSEYDWYAEELHQRVGPEHIAAALALAPSTSPAPAQPADAPAAQNPPLCAVPQAGRHRPVSASEREDDSARDNFLSANTTPHSSSAPFAPTSALIKLPHGNQGPKGIGSILGGGVLLEKQPREVMQAGVNQKKDWVYC